MKKILLLLLLTCSLSGWATNYYVATAAAGGSNSNNGSLSSPWLTLYYASTQVTTPGDVIRIASGTFTETQISNLNLGVSVEGTGVGSTTIISHYSVTDSYGIMNLESATEGTNGNQYISGISFDGDNLTGRVAITIYKRSNVTIHDCNFTNFNDFAIFLYGNPAWYTEPTTYSTGNAVYNCIINNCSLYGTWGRGAIFFGGQSGFLIHDNTITQTQRPSGSNGYGLKGAIGFNKGMKIYNNTITVSPYDGTQYSFAMEFWHSQGGMEVYNNVLKGRVDFGGYGSFKGAYAYGVYFHDNICGWDTQQANENVGLHWESTSEYVIAERNTFKYLTNGIYMTFQDIAGSYANYVTIRNNIFYNNYTPVNINGATFTPVISNLFFYNNVFYSNPSTDVGIDLSLDNQAAISNLNIKNNVFQGFANSPVRYYSNGLGSLDGVYLQNNDLYLNGNSNLPRYVNITPTNTTTSGNISVAPLFISATDYHLQSSSSCIDAGINVGLPYGGSAPDIGAYESIPASGLIKSYGKFVKY